MLRCRRRGGYYPPAALKDGTSLFYTKHVKTGTIRADNIRPYGSNATCSEIAKHQFVSRDGLAEKKLTGKGLPCQPFCGSVRVSTVIRVPWIFSQENSFASSRGDMASARSIMPAA